MLTFMAKHQGHREKTLRLQYLTTIDEKDPADGMCIHIIFYGEQNVTLILKVKGQGHSAIELCDGILCTIVQN